MATGYTLRTPRQNGGIRHGVTVVNPLSRNRTVRFGDGSGFAYADALENPRSSSKKRRSGQYTRGRTVRGKLVSRKQAGSKARTSTRAARKYSVRSGTRRSRPQSRTTARASGQVATKRKSPKRARRSVKRVRVRATRGRRGYLRKLPRKTARRAAPKRRSVRRTARRTTRKGRLVRNATQRWITDTHPGTGERGIQGRPMTVAERSKWTARGAVRTELKAKVAQRVRVSPLKRRAQAVGGVAKAGVWRSGVVHPVSGKPVGGTVMSARDRQLFRADGTSRKGVGAATVVKAYSLTGGTKVKKSRTRRTGAVRKTRKTRKAAKGRRVRVPAKRSRTGRIVRKSYSYTKPARRRRVRKAAKRVGVRRYRVKASRGRKSYLRRYASKTRKTRKVARKTGVRRYRVKASRGRKSYLRRYATKTRKTRKVARKTSVRRYRVKASKGRKSYVRRYPRKTRRTAKKAVRRTRKVARKTGVRRYRVKASRGRKSYMRRYARKTRKVARRAGIRRYRVKSSRGRKSYMRRYARRYARKGAKRAIAVRKTGRYRVRKHSGGTYLRRYRKGSQRRYAKRAGARRYSRKTTVRVPALRRGGKIVRKGYSYKRRAKIARNPYKRSRVRVHGYGYTRRHPKTKRVKVRSYRRSQWYPHSYEGRWISQSKSKALGLLSKREMAAMARRHGLRANPGSALAMLPTGEQLKTIGVMAGEGFLGFGGAIAMGRALSAVPSIANVTGVWTSVLGNLAAGLGFWALAHFMPENEKLQEAKPYVMAGVGIAAVVNTILNLVSGGTIPSNYGSWLIPGVAAAPAVPVVTPTAGFGQIDIYEAALNGVSGIESELEHELDRMGGGDGIFGDTNEGIFSGLDGTGTPVRQAYAGMGEYMKTPMSGVNVEEAYSGVGEYFKTPTGEYLETPMGGVNVQQAYAGMGEYFKAPMGAYVEEAFAGGMGFSAAQIGAETPVAAVEQSLQTQPLMPGFRAAVQKLVRDRIAAGQPLDDAFYAKLGTASASLARRKFNQRVAQVSAQPQDIGTQAWLPPVTNQAVPNFRSPITDPSMVPGNAEAIEDVEGNGGEGIFDGFQEGTDEGIF